MIKHHTFFSATQATPPPPQPMLAKARGLKGKQSSWSGLSEVNTKMRFLHPISPKIKLRKKGEVNYRKEQDNVFQNPATYSVLTYNCLHEYS